METLFDKGGALRFHAEKAAVTSICSSDIWPPYIAAAVRISDLYVPVCHFAYLCLFLDCSN